MIHDNSLYVFGNTHCINPISNQTKISDFKPKIKSLYDYKVKKAIEAAAIAVVEVVVTVV